MGFRSSTSNLQFATAVVDSTTTVPAGVQAGDRVYALVGTGATTALPVTGPSGWTMLGSYAPTSNFTEQLWYRDVTSSSEAGVSKSWTWANTSRTWAIMLAYSGVDTSRAPAYNTASYATTSAGPFNAPTVVVPDSDWLITLASGRESPGTDTAKSWTINAAGDVERFDGYTSQTGTGQKFVLAAYDSAGTLTTTGGGGGVDVGPQAPPTNSFNKIVTAANTFKVGATVKKEDLSYWAPKLAANQIMRIFPDSDGLPPDWTDSRFGFIRDFGGDPFVSCKIDSDATKLNSLVTYLNAMPSWIRDDPDRTLWITDRHEPEGDVTATAFQANFTAFFNKLATLDSTLRAKIKAGPVLTRQYTENTSGRSYATYDPGIGDFFGVDMYANSWGSPSTDVATSFPNAVTFLSRFKAYQKTSGDHRLRIMPELGGIGIPNDTDGTIRAAWIEALFAEMASWTYAAQGWDFGGALWWLAEGKSGTSLNGAGTKRWFQFDRRHTGTDGSYAIIPSVAATTGGGGSTASARTVSTNIPVTQAHVWSVTVPMTPPVVVDPTTVNAWSNLGLPQR